eukprot:846193-Amphidinium_carterae.1
MLHHAMCRARFAKDAKGRGRGSVKVRRATYSNRTTSINVNGTCLLTCQHKRSTKSRFFVACAGKGFTG